jgi:hypothetical protein
VGIGKVRKSAFRQQDFPQHSCCRQVPGSVIILNITIPDTKLIIVNPKQKLQILFLKISSGSTGSSVPQPIEINLHNN